MSKPASILISELEERLNADLDELADAWSSNDLWEAIVNGDFIFLTRKDAQEIIEALKPVEEPK